MALPATSLLLDQLRAHRQTIQSLGRQFGARHMRVFGSVVRGEEGERSDIDLLVEFPRGYNILLQRISLSKELSLLFDRPST